MNKYQKEVEKQLLEDEKEILEELKNNYAKALKDVKERIKSFTDDELTQSKIYQKQYQENLERQLQSIVDLLSSDNVKSISDYLEKTYQDGFIGTLYNMQNEGVPFVMPINQEAVIKSITKKTEDFKLSKTLYQNAEELKKTIKSEITRGISQGASYTNISKKIALNSEADFKKSYRIARTEGGRVQTEAKFECMTRAKANGADVVKEWDSTIDGRTRQTHAMLDGQIKELEEPFEINGMKAMYPHGFGIAEEDINCRCAVLERARWAIEDDDSFTKNIDGDIVEFKNVKDYQDYKQKYFDFYEDKNENDFYNIQGNKIDFSSLNIEKESNKRAIEDIKNLIAEYNTRLTSVSTGNTKYAGEVDLAGNMMLKNTRMPTTYYHEFAHSITQSRLIKYGLAEEQDKKFWEEANQLFKNYKKELRELEKNNYSQVKNIKISDYSLENVDEFIAEGFSRAKLDGTEYISKDLAYNSNTLSKYATKVLNLINKYFKK